jgi:Flp pilus assembly protein TadD
MPRRIRLVFSLLFVAVALSAAACADSTAPRQSCDTSSQNTCLQH